MPAPTVINTASGDAIPPGLSSLTIPAATAGNSILLFLRNQNVGTPTIADNAGNTYTRLSGGTFTQLWSSIGIVGSPTQINFTGGDIAFVLSAEISASAIDQHANLSFAPSTTWTGAPVTTTQLNELILGYGFASFSVGGSVTVTAGVGWSMVTQMTDPGFQITQFLEDQTRGSFGTYTPTATSVNTGSTFVEEMWTVSLYSTASPPPSTGSTQGFLFGF